MGEDLVLGPKRPRRVAILAKAIAHYRRPFYERLKERLQSQGVELRLIYGQVGEDAAKKRDKTDIGWAIPIRNRIYRVGGRESYWQPAFPHLEGADLVVVVQESKLLTNYLLLLQQVLGIRRVAFWGHGRAFQRHRITALGEALKRLLSRNVHWWFAYTESAAQAVRELGFAPDRITVVNNAIDTKSLIRARSEIDPSSVARIRNELGIRSDNVGLFIGGMYPEKRLEFLLRACVRIRELLPDFEVIFIGAGPDEMIIREAAAQTPWIHYLGPQFDERKVPYFMCSRLLLMPGLVGLAVLDAFALEVPLVTTRVPYHSPEIDYLIDGMNGIIVDEPDDIEAYAESVVDLLTDDLALERLKGGCREARDHYTIEAMVDRFAEGILRALAA